MSLIQTVSLVAACLLLPAVHGLHAYGHAFSRPNDFTPAQYADIAKMFPVFTVEKAMAQAVYGNHSAPAPFKTNSIAATIGTAKQIKKLNPEVKVLMYWNTALFFNFYECEAEVDQDTWLEHSDTPPPVAPFYNYSVPAFRAWWVKCAIDAVNNSDGLLDGLFLDATPKLVKNSYTKYFTAMVDELKTALPHAFITNNGFYLTKSGDMYGGEDVWSHTKNTYVESLEKIGNTDIFTKELSMTYLTGLSNATSAHPDRLLIGHGSNANTTVFYSCLVKYLLITSSVEDGYYLANDGYGIDQGLLEQPMSVFAEGDGVGCGEPNDSYFTVEGDVVKRAFEKGSVELNLETGEGKIDCTGRQVAF